MQPRQDPPLQERSPAALATFCAFPCAQRRVRDRSLAIRLLVRSLACLSCWPGGGGIEAATQRPDHRERRAPFVCLKPNHHEPQVMDAAFVGEYVEIAGKARLVATTDQCQGVLAGGQRSSGSCKPLVRGVALGDSISDLLKSGDHRLVVVRDCLVIGRPGAAVLRLEGTALKDWQADCGADVAEQRPGVRGARAAGGHHEGEIVGLIGLVGSGRLTGRLTPDGRLFASGTLVLNSETKPLLPEPTMQIPT